MYEQKPLQTKAYEYLVEQIESGTMKPGVIYSETKIAAQIGISRTPFKDALVRLAQDRYVDIIPSKGFCLHMITEEDIENTYEVRCAIECYCAMDLFRKRDGLSGRGTVSIMKESLDLQSAALDAGDLSGFVKADDRFHQAVIEFTGNPEFMRIYGNFSHWISELATATLRKEGRMSRAYEEHTGIYEALLGDDTGSLYRAVSGHLEVTRKMSLEIYQG